jgi:hypothetical protein
MPDQVRRFRWVEKLASWAALASLVCLALVLAGAVAFLVRAVLGGSAVETILGAAVVIVIVLVEAVWVFVLYGVIRVLTANEAAVTSADAHIARVESLLTSQEQSYRKLIDLGSLSDQAKSLIFREREMEAFRATIHEDLMCQDYTSAELLIDSMEKRFGYEEEAATLRREVEDSRKATMEEKIDAAIARIQGLLDRYDWPQALRESARLQKLFPENEKIAALPDRVERARSRRKRELLQRYGEAVRRNDIDRSIELLKELDLYLTPQEGAALQESARGIFKAKLHNLGVQFTLAVTDQQWARAVETGEEIVREFPNTRMAQEVRGKIDTLRARASQVAQAPGE